MWCFIFPIPVSKIHRCIKRSNIKEKWETMYRILQRLRFSHPPIGKPFMFSFFVMEMRKNEQPLLYLNKPSLHLKEKRQTLSGCRLGRTSCLLSLFTSTEMLPSDWRARHDVEQADKESVRNIFGSSRLTWRWWRCEGVWCPGSGTGGSSSRRYAAWPCQRRQCRHLPQSERTGWGWTPPERRNPGKDLSPVATLKPQILLCAGRPVVFRVSFAPLTLTAEATSSGSCTSSPSLQVYKQSITFLFSSLPERIISPARLPRKNWAIRAFPPGNARMERRRTQE